MLLRFVLQTLATALTLWLITALLPWVAVSSTGMLVASAVLVGIANALVRPVLHLAIHPVTGAWIALMVILVNVLAALLGPALTLAWDFATFGDAAATVAILSAVSIVTAVVPFSSSDRRIGWGLLEPRTPTDILEDDRTTAH